MSKIGRKSKIALIVVLCIVFCVGIVAGAMAGVATKAIDNQKPDEFLRSWMSYVSDDTLLTDMVIPGSHDSGTTKMMWAAKTQDKSIKEQMACGARYFDIRPQLKDGKLVVFHGPITGEDVEPIIDDIKQFLTANPSETLILDFQHFMSDETAIEKTDELLSDKLDGLMVANKTELSDLDFVKSLTLADTRGKAIVFFGNVFKNTTNCDYINGKNYLFQRNGDSDTRQGSGLQSFYDGSLNRKSSKKYLANAIPKYVDAFENSEGGLFVMQMQLTDPIAIIGPKFYEGTHDENATRFISSLPGKDYFGRVNIIMRDFVGAEKCRQIIALNKDKETIANDKLSEFASKCA